MTTTTAPSALTQGELRIATLLAHGLKDHEISDKLGITCGTVSVFKTKIRKKLACPFRCSTAVLVDRLFQWELVSPPDTTTTVPDLDEQELRLLHAITERTRPYDIARAAGIASRDYHSTLAALLDKTGADATTQLVVFARAWNLLDRTGQHASTAGASR
ncbi:helix-turn-helix domain-containing protein [Streptomyces sp. NPDC002671]